MGTVKKEFDLAIVGGSDLNKIKEQLGGKNIFEKYKYVFAENGLIAFKEGKQLPTEVSDTIKRQYCYKIFCFLLFISYFRQFKVLLVKRHCKI